MIFNMTGGGNPLNFKVVGGTTAPSNPKENTIWVNTDKEITGWHFTSEQPEDMKEGEVWFGIGTSSPVEFNALKKNNVTVYPMSAKQMVSGTLKNVTSKSYQGGKWVEWVTYLYDKGNECTDITGGWALSQNYTGSHGDSLTKKETSMVFSTSYVLNVHNANGFLRANKKIDLTEKNTIAAKLISASIGVPIYLCVKQNDIAVKEMIAYSQINSGDTKTQLDVTNLSGEYYVGFGADAGYGESSVEIQQVNFS